MPHNEAHRWVKFNYITFTYTGLFIVLHLAEMDVLSLIIACFLYVVPIFVFSSYVLYKETQEACAYCLLLNNNLIYGHLNRGWRNSVLGTCI